MGFQVWKKLALNGSKKRQTGVYLFNTVSQNGNPCWDDLGNAALKSTRKDPNILLPGDRLHVPPRRPGDVSCATDMLNKFPKVVDVPTGEQGKLGGRRGRIG
jgi:hypothetical protein